ncbi:MAG: hypothetical protein H0U92_15210 [Actinobacteria bacterium]|nr:hypothetical protein [Actinomycetota bacterium]
MREAIGGTGRVASQRAPRTAALIKVAAALGVLASAQACGIGDKAGLADRITAGPALAETSIVVGSVSVESRIVDVPAGAGGGFTGAGGGFPGAALPVDGAGPSAQVQPPGLPPDGVSLGRQSLGFELDVARSRAVLTRTGLPGALVIANDIEFFGRRAAAAPNDSRPWVRMTLDRIDLGAGEIDPFEGAASAVAVLNPAVILDMAAGALTGSIKRRGAALVGGTTTQRFDFNVSLDKAFGDVRRSRYSEDKRDLMFDYLDLLGVDGRVHAASAWLDKDDRIRRFSVKLTQRPRTRFAFDFIVTLDLDRYAGTYSGLRPLPDEVLGVDTLVGFVNAVLPPPTDGASPLGAPTTGAAP